MNKKILVGVGIVFMLITISLATAINNIKNQEKKESPLFRIRANGSLNKKTSELANKIISKFIRHRVFFIRPKKIFNEYKIDNELYSCTDCSQLTCTNTFCSSCTYDKSCTYATCTWPRSSS